MGPAAHFQERRADRGRDAPGQGTPGEARSTPRSTSRVVRCAPVCAGCVRAVRGRAQPANCSQQHRYPGDDAGSAWGDACPHLARPPSPDAPRRQHRSHAAGAYAARGVYSRALGPPTNHLPNHCLMHSPMHARAQLHAQPRLVLCSRPPGKDRSFSPRTLARLTQQLTPLARRFGGRLHVLTGRESLLEQLRAASYVPPIIPPSQDPNRRPEPGPRGRKRER